MQIKLLVDGGAMKPGPALSQKMGPLGINLGKVIADVNKATSEFRGMKVPVIMDIDTKTKNFTLKTLTPPASELLKKEFMVESGSPQPNKIKVANASFEGIVKVAKVKQDDMFVNSLKEAVKSILGTCTSVGILVEGKDPKEIIAEVNQGKWKEIIDKEIEKPSQEKLDKLASEFEKIKKTQDAYLKEIEKKKEEATAAAAAAAPAPGAAAPAAGAAPGAAAAPAATAAAPAKKK
jgi:large subunit ribosomal protein L11